MAARGLARLHAKVFIMHQLGSPNGIPEAAEGGDSENRAANSARHRDDTSAYRMQRNFSNYNFYSARIAE